MGLKKYFVFPAILLIPTLTLGPLSALALEQFEPVETPSEIASPLSSVIEATSTQPDPAPAEQEETIPTTPVYDPTTYIPGEVVVTYKDASVDVVQASTAVSMEDAVAQIETDPNVAYAEPNYVRSIESLSSTSPELANLWAFQNTGQRVNGVTGSSDADTDALEGWSIATGTDQVVAVIDTGVDYDHPDLSANMWDGSSCLDDDGAALGSCIHGYDFDDDDTNPMPATTGISVWHGTLVAGVLAATYNDIGVVGMAHGARIMALRFGLDTASEVRAIDFARENGAKIINASFSGSASSTAEYDAIKRFTDSGGLFVVAAANDSSNLNATTTLAYPASYDLPGIISVAATDQRDSLASYSNYGVTLVDLGAPGSNIKSTMSSTTTSSNLYAYNSGTSLAAPMVSGAVALVEGLRPDLSSQEVKDLILSSGDALPSLATTTVSGKRLNVNNALKSLVATSMLDTTAPLLTLLGDNPLRLNIGDAFTDPGAQVTDDHDATTTILGSGTVNTGTPGTYILTYSTHDSAGNSALSLTRDVIVSVAAAPPVSSGGGGGGGGGSSSSSSSSGSSGGSSSSTTKTTPSAPAVPSVPRFLQTQATGQVLGAATYQFTQALSAGARGSDVTELQKLLARLTYYTGPVTGYLGPLTGAGIRAFQSAHSLAVTGIVDEPTRIALNQVPGVSVVLAPSSVQTQINALLALVAQLQARLAELQKAGH